MRKKIIKASVVFCIVFNIALVCSMETHASPIQEEQANTTTDVNETSTIESAQSVSPNAVLEGRKRIESVNSVPAEETDTITTFNPYWNRRIVAVGDLPADHDPSLVLRKGQIITVSLNDEIENEVPLEGCCFSNIKKNVYDESGNILLMPTQAQIVFLYKIIEEQDRIKMNITVIEMHLDLIHYVSVRFSDPPHTTVGNGFTLKPLSSVDTARVEANMKKKEEEALRLKERLFSSPVISAELLFEVESEDRAPVRGKVIFGENASGKRTLYIGSAYRLELRVNKDILFSGPFIPRGKSMIRMIERNR